MSMPMDRKCAGSMIWRPIWACRYSLFPGGQSGCRSRRLQRGHKTFCHHVEGLSENQIIGHADAFWANISADYAETNLSHRAGGARRNIGSTFVRLSQHVRRYFRKFRQQCLGPRSGLYEGFLKRHQDKLHFGSDCNCDDGRGGGAAQNSDSVAPRMRGKCVARETLTLLQLPPRRKYSARSPGKMPSAVGNACLGKLPVAEQRMAL